MEKAQDDWIKLECFVLSNCSGSILTVKEDQLDKDKSPPLKCTEEQ